MSWLRKIQARLSVWAVDGLNKGTLRHHVALGWYHQDMKYAIKEAQRMKPYRE